MTPEWGGPWRSVCGLGEASMDTPRDIYLSNIVWNESANSKSANADETTVQEKIYYYALLHFVVSVDLQRKFTSATNKTPKATRHR
jgi:hypothetical protein